MANSNAAAANTRRVLVDSDTEDFKALYEEHKDLVRSVIYQIAGPLHLNDLVQDAFIKIWKGRSGFNEESKISSWIYRISTNVAIDSFRATKRRKENFEFDFSQLVDDKNGAELELENYQLVQRGLATLSEDHRAVLVLAYIHDRPISEIADVLEISEGTVKSRLHYAKDLFSSYLQSKGFK